ncbi:M15 family metallopeptidase [Konateibacter massiliensis]|uniref:M15 family metallopeptidase n=1 Tax=Konateibacter massiliensis TaxID=2002841 RepID=UPI0015D4C4C8|nr:M15 family metallopeptidase [Konateibacter massiliensis]
MWKKSFFLLTFVLVLAGCGRTEQVIETKSEESSKEEEITAGTESAEETKNAEVEENAEETGMTGEAGNSSTALQEETTAEGETEKEAEIAKKYNLPEGFVYVDDVIPTAELEIRYYTDYNFVGEKIDGYAAPLAILTTQAADALKQASDRLLEDGYHLKIYDGYRPQKAVDHFVRWSQESNDSMKEIFYPSLEKDILFTSGYISKKSRHSRGSTVDITIVNEEGVEVDMGSYFDMLDTISNYDTDKITDQQHKNREYLRSIMDAAGFDSIRTEWWHFQLRDEPYPSTYFDFDIE